VALVRLRSDRVLDVTPKTVRPPVSAPREPQGANGPPMVLLARSERLAGLEASVPARARLETIVHREALVVIDRDGQRVVLEANVPRGPNSRR